jgi:hypothetical protein
MNKFSAKFSEQIEGTISGFDRLVFRGTLRAIAYEVRDEDVFVAQPGAAEGFWQACGADQSGAKGGGYRSGATSWPAGTVSTLQPGEQRGNSAPDRSPRSNPHRTGLCVDERGAVLELRDRCAESGPETGFAGGSAQVSAHLPILATSSVWLFARAHPNLVSVFDPDLSQRTGMAGAADGASPTAICARIIALLGSKTTRGRRA